ncbi:MAG: hypothetical protein NT005_10860, partial [Spirochaetes bacterium]|nr:hypothetical protein [Spirochaetota bacterium]
MRIAVQRDDEPDIRQMLRVADVHERTGVRRPRSIDQPVELFQLPAFALPTDVFLLGFTPNSFPVEKEETLATIALIEGFEPVDCCLKQGFVFLAVRFFRIRVIREQAEEQIVLSIRQIADFKPVDLRSNRPRVHKQHGHDDQRSKGVGNSRHLEIHLREGAGRKNPHDQVIH